ncbi:XRE family transcriptional regulator [Serratia sp. D1N4]
MIEPMVQEDKVRQIFAQRLALACDRAKLEVHGRQTDIAKALRVTPKAVSKWFNAESIPRRGKMAELADYVGVRSDWLLGEYEENQIFDDAPITPGYSRAFRVDVFDVQASAGPGVINNEVIQTIRSIEYTDDHALYMFGGKQASHIKMITVDGDSMSGTIEIGDSIFVDVSKDYFNGDGIYVFLYKNHLHVKRLQMLADRLLVHSDNSQYTDWEIDEDNEQHLKVMGRVLLSQSQAFKRHG